MENPHENKRWGVPPLRKPPCVQSRNHKNPRKRNGLSNLSIDSPVLVSVFGKSQETEVSERKFDHLEDLGEGAPTLVPALEEERSVISLPELRRPRVLQTRGRGAYAFPVLGREERDVRCQITWRLPPDS